MIALRFFLPLAVLVVTLDRDPYGTGCIDVGQAVHLAGCRICAEECLDVAVAMPMVRRSTVERSFLEHSR